MSDIKKKLGLYNTGSSASPPPAPPADEPGTAGQAFLLFDEYRFEEIAPAVYRYRTLDDNPGMGRRRLREYLPLRLSGILELALWPQPEALHPEDVLFLDTETTGLTRGTGTLPFLTGLASFESNALCRELIYLAEPGGEEAYLDYIQSRFKRFAYLVSYNGRAFDVPLLRNRLILNRKPGLPEFLHFDLLHIFRRLFPKGSLNGYRQMDLEQRLLEHERSDDLPGAEIPQIYFDYVKYGHDGGMGRVFRHNLRDLTGMVLLLLEAIRTYEGRATARGSVRSGLARILMRNRRPDEAIESLEELFRSQTEDDDRSATLRYRDYLLLAQLYRMRGRFAEAAAVFGEVIDKYDCPYARMSLAKLREHRLKDFEGALAMTRELLERGAKSELPANEIYSAQSLQHREQRILRKIERARGH